MRHNFKVMMEYHSHAGRQILIMDIELGEGRTAELVVHEHDEPSELARAFCRRHHLDVKVKEILEQQIYQNLAAMGSQEPSFQEASPATNQFLMDSSHMEASLPSRSPMRGRPEELSQGSLSTMLRPTFDNVGQKLYFKGVKMRERTERNLQKLKQMKADSEARNFTFKPQVYSKVAREPRRPEFSLLQKGKEYLENNEKRRGQKLSQEMEKCTFTPDINRTTSMLQSYRKNLSSGRYAFLYVDAKERELHRSQLSES